MDQTQMEAMQNYHDQTKKKIHTETLSISAVSNKDKCLLTKSKSYFSKITMAICKKMNSREYKK